MIDKPPEIGSIWRSASGRLYVVEKKIGLHTVQDGMFGSKVDGHRLANDNGKRRACAPLKGYSHDHHNPR